MHLHPTQSVGLIPNPQYARLVNEWVTSIGLHREEYGTHSLRRSQASIIYKATRNLRAVQILLGIRKSRIQCAIWVSMLRMP
jgi:site-specific recombinase XerC